MRIPTSEQLAVFCMSQQYRRCDVYRRFLVALAERPERWRSTTEFGPDGRARRMKGE